MRHADWTRRQSSQAPQERKSRQQSESARPQEADAGSEQEDQPTRPKRGMADAETGEGGSAQGARQPKAYSDLNDALARLEELLFSELQRWPEWGRRQLGDELRKFADINCV